MQVMKRIFCFVLSMVIFSGLIVQQAAAADLEENAQRISEEVVTDVSPATEQAPMEPQILVDENPISDAKIIFVNDQAYIPLRATSVALCPGVDITWENSAAQIKAGDLCATISPNATYIIANGQSIDCPTGVYCENGSIYLPVDILADIFGSTYTLEPDTQNIYFKTRDDAITPEDQVSDEIATEITPTPEEEQTPTNQLFVDETPIADAKIILIDGYAYIPLRAASMALRSDLSIAWENNAAQITADGLSATISLNTTYVIANERCLYLPDGVYCENGAIYLPAKILASIFDATYTFDPDTNNIYFKTGSGAIMHADQFYNNEDLYWLSHIINAESGNQPLLGKIAVGNVILNRVANTAFPDFIYDVIYQKNQFSPTWNGTIHLVPNDESVVAAKLCLEGAVVLPTALYFNHVNINSWAAKHKTYVATIGSHAFYA